MKKLIFVSLAALLLMANALYAQSVNKTEDPKQQSPGSTGAMQNAPANGVATDPQQVQSQQGTSRSLRRARLAQRQVPTQNPKGLGSK